MKLIFSSIVFSGLLLLSTEISVESTFSSAAEARVITPLMTQSNQATASHNIQLAHADNGSSRGGLLHRIISTISHGIASVGHFISQSFSNVSRIIHTSTQVYKMIYPEASKWLQTAFHNFIQGTNTIPAPLTPSQGVLANSRDKIPVILVHGGFSNADDMKLYYKAFEKADIPAYAPTLGTGPSGVIPLLDPALGGTNHINQSAQQLSNFIDKVQKETGSPKVDLVGVSQGGMIIQDYMVHDKKDNVEAVATMGGAIHGTTYNGLLGLLHSLPTPISHFFKTAISTIEGPSNIDLLNDSSFVHEMDQYPDTKPGINYLDIASNTDAVITPWKSAFRTQGPGSQVSNVEVHSIPGVPADFTHGQYGKIQAIVDRAVQFIQTRGENRSNISDGLSMSNALLPHPEMRNTSPQPAVTPPAVSLLG